MDRTDLGLWNRLLAGLHVGHTMPVKSAIQFLLISDSTCNKQVAATFRVEDRCLDHASYWIFLPALEAETAAGYIFTLHDFLRAVTPNVGRGLHGGTFLPSSFRGGGRGKSVGGGTLSVTVSLFTFFSPVFRHGSICPLP